MTRDTGVPNLGFYSQGAHSNCGFSRVTVTVPSSTLFVYRYSHDFSLHACCPPGGTVTAEVLRGSSVLANDDQRVSVPFPEVSISAQQSSVIEGEHITFAVTAKPIRKSDLVVKLSVTDAGDYLLATVPSSVRIPANRKTEFIVVQTEDDRVDEPVGSVTATIQQDDDRYSLGSPISTKVPVEDDDVKVYFESSDHTVDEGSRRTVTVRLSEKGKEDLDMPTTVTPSGTAIRRAESGDCDVNGLTNDDKLRFSAWGSMSRTFTMVGNRERNQDSDAADELLRLGFDSDDLPYGVAEGSPPSVTVTILDDDRTVSYNSSSYTVDEGSNTAITVELSGYSSRAPDIPITDAPTGSSIRRAESGDYSVNGLTNDDKLSFSEWGSTSRTFPIAGNQDDDADDETISLVFDSDDLPEGVSLVPQSNATATILDDDRTVSFSAQAYSVDENSQISLWNLRELRLSGNSLTGYVPLELPVPVNDLGSLGLPYCEPRAPENLSAGTPSVSSIVLSWDAVPGPPRYRVEHRSATSTEWTVDDDAIIVTSHTVDGLACGTEYSLRVQSYGDGATHETVWSLPSGRGIRDDGHVTTVMAESDKSEESEVSAHFDDRCVPPVEPINYPICFSPTPTEEPTATHTPTKTPTATHTCKRRSNNGPRRRVTAP